MAVRQIARGTGGNQFTPERPMTRAEFVALLVRTLAFLPTRPSALSAGTGSVLTAFADVPATRWYAAELQEAWRLGIVQRADGPAFRPEAHITRQEMAVLMLRALRARGHAVPKSDIDVLQAAYADVADVDAASREAVSVSVQLQLVRGRTGTLSGRPVLLLAPQGNGTRAEVITVLYRLMKLLE